MKCLTYERALHTLIMEYNNYKSGSSEKVIAQTILKNIRHIPSYTIEQTAECCNISVSTCRRFIHNLGYESYSEFRQCIKENIDSLNLYFPTEINKSMPETTPFLEHYNELISNDLTNLVNLIHRSDMIQAVQMLHDYDKIFIHDIFKGGTRMYLERNLALDGKLITLSSDYTSQINDIKNLSGKNLFLVVYEGMTHSKIVLQTIQSAKKQDAAVIAISNQKNFTNSELCDLIIFIPQGSCNISKQLLLDMVYQYLAELYRSIYLSQL